jgi:hypothetical protein
MDNQLGDPAMKKCKILIISALALIMSSAAHAQLHTRTLGSHDGYDGACHYRFTILKVFEGQDSWINCSVEIEVNGMWQQQNALELWDSGSGTLEPAYSDLFNSCDSHARTRCGAVLGGGGGG